MKCVDVEKLLDDLVDGALPANRAAEVENHIASCQTCQTAERRLKTLLAEAQNLEASLEPPRDLWLGIAQRIEAEGEGARGPSSDKNKVLPIRGFRRRLLPYLAAAAALIMGIVGSLWIPALAGSGNGGRAAFEYRPRAIPASFKRSPALAETQAAFEAARAELYAALRSRRGSLSKETLKVIEKNLRIIDDAAAEIEAALEKDPGNEELSSFLVMTYESEIRMLRQAALQPGGI